MSRMEKVGQRPVDPTKSVDKERREQEREEMVKRTFD